MEYVSTFMYCTVRVGTRKLTVPIFVTISSTKKCSYGFQVSALKIEGFKIYLSLKKYKPIKGGENSRIEELK